jgi:shikimate 5-dehydrogenase
MTEVHPLIQLAVVVLGSGGTSWAAVRATLNGTRENVRDLKQDVSKISDNVADVRERLARIEGRRINDK